MRQSSSSRLVVAALSLLVHACAASPRDGHVGSRELTQPLAEAYVNRHYVFCKPPCSGCGVVGASEIPIEGTFCTDPSPSEFAASIPRLGSPTAIVRTGGDVGPGADDSFRWFEFTPEVVGDHLVVSKVVSCHCRCDQLDCTYAEAGGVFDENPVEYFSLGPEVRREEAFEAARLYRSGKIEPNDWFWPWDSLANLRIQGFVSHIFDTYPALLLYLSSEACSFVVPVRVQGEGESRHLRVLGEVRGACV